MQIVWALRALLFFIIIVYYYYLLASVGAVAPLTPNCPTALRGATSCGGKVGRKVAESLLPLLFPLLLF